MRTRLRHSLVCLAAIACACADDARDSEGRDSLAGSAELRAPSHHAFSDLCTAPTFDGEAVTESLRNGAYAELEPVIDRVHENYWSNPSCEYQVLDLLEGFSNQSFAVLDAWLEVEPDSWAALGARGDRWRGEGYGRRGTELSRKVTEEQWSGMREAFALANADLRKAIELEPRSFFAYMKLMSLLRASGDKSEIRPYLDRLLEHDPSNYRVRRAAIYAFSPRWGGSYDQIREIATEAQSHLEENPRLRLLLGLEDADIANEKWIAKDYLQAIEYYRRALSYGGLNEWYESLCKLYYKTGDFNGAIRAANEWLDYDPHSAIALHWRGKSYKSVGVYDRALADFDAAVDRSPNDESIRRSRAHLHEIRGDDRAAVEDLKRALERDSDDGWTLLHLATLLAGPLDAPDEAEIHLRRLIELEPETAQAWFQLGSLRLARGDADARSILEHYLSLAQGRSEEGTRIASAKSLLSSAGAASDGASNIPGLAQARRSAAQ